MHYKVTKFFMIEFQGYNIQTPIPSPVPFSLLQCPLFPFYPTSLPFWQAVLFIFLSQDGRALQFSNGIILK